MNYILKYFESEGKKEDIVFDFGEEHSLISLFLSGECDLLDTFLEHIDLVLSDKFERAEVRGNICFVEVHKDISRVEHLYPDEDDEAEGIVNEESISTVELKRLIEEYSVKRDEFFRMKKLGEDDRIY